MKIRSCEAKDLQALCEIYNHYIEHTVITFEEIAVDIAEMAKRVQQTTRAFPWLVCELDSEIVGFAYADKWKGRSAYKYSLETTVYVRHSCLGAGVGKALYTSLLGLLTQANCHVILACIALPNAASVGLHEYFGFKKVAHFAEVGHKFRRWVDVGYWQKSMT